MRINKHVNIKKEIAIVNFKIVTNNHHSIARCSRRDYWKHNLAGRNFTPDINFEQPESKQNEPAELTQQKPLN